MQNKIRMAQEQKVPYMLVLGDREIEARTASPRTRAGEQLPAEGWEDLAGRLAAEAAARRPELISQLGRGRASWVGRSLPLSGSPWYSPAAAGGLSVAVSVKFNHRIPEGSPSAEICALTR